MDNRIIKFKVWDIKAKRMSPEFHLFGEFTLLGAVHDWQRESGIEGDSLGRLNDLMELQFTGLHDLNGNEIYEGDILGNIHSIYEHVGVVIYNNHTACFELKVFLSTGGTTIWKLRHKNANKKDKPIVIGNMFTTPELIKK